MTTIEHVQEINQSYKEFAIKCVAMLKVEESRDALSAACDSMNSTMNIMTHKAQHIRDVTNEAAVFIESINSAADTLLNSRASLEKVNSDLLNLRTETVDLLDVFQHKLNALKDCLNAQAK